MTLEEQGGNNEKVDRLYHESKSLISVKDIEGKDPQTKILLSLGICKHIQ